MSRASGSRPTAAYCEFSNLKAGFTEQHNTFLTNNHTLRTLPSSVI